jgi:hypothetical protein
MSALQNLPLSIQNQLAGAALRIQNNAAAIYDLLDRKRVPVKVESIKNELGIGTEEYRTARKLLMNTNLGVYITHEGITLQKYLTAEEQRYWHLAWSLGLFEVSGGQLLLDEDLLEKAPDALVKLLNEGKLTQHNRLSALQTRTRQSLGVMLKLVEMYRRIDRALGLFLLPHVSGNEWKKTLGEIKKQLKSVP